METESHLLVLVFFFLDDFSRGVRPASSSVAVASSSSSAALFLPSIFSEVIGRGVPVLELLALSVCDFGASATLRKIRKL